MSTATAAIDEHDVTVYVGGAAAVLAAQPSGSVSCLVTSPPYLGLRDYGTEPFDWPEIAFVPIVGLPALTVPAMRCSLGLESDPWAFVAHLVHVMREAKRVLADDGVLWLNLGDTYSTRSTAKTSSHQDSLNGAEYGKDWLRDKAAGLTRMPTSLPEKNLMGIPWRVSFALQADGWILRNDVIWNKPNGMPDSVQDRLACKHEDLFLFSKSRRYWFDLDPIREPLKYPDAADGSRVFGGKNKASELNVGASARTTGRTWGERKQAGAPPRRGTDPSTSIGDSDFATHPGGRNPGDVWTISTSPFPGAHFATMPPEIARRCILAGCPEGGTVYDPFTGSGTTAMVARQLGRRFAGSELNPDYIPIIRGRIGATPFQFGEPA